MGSRVRDLGQSGICRPLNSLYIGVYCRPKRPKMRFADRHHREVHYDVG